MRKTKKVVLLLMVTVAISCSSTQSLREILETIPAKKFEHYDFSATSKLVDRVNNSSDIVMDYLHKYDDPNGEYSLYNPSAREMELLSDYLEMLPDRFKETLRDKLLGIYIVSNFAGSGMADYVISEEDTIYTILILNPVVFTTSLSELLTYRETTCFRSDNPDMRVEIELSDEYKGLIYILMHECAHIFDFAERVTPFVEPAMEQIQGRKAAGTPFTSEYWSRYDRLDTDVRVDYQDKIRFYGKDALSKISNSELLEVYREFEKTPFASLYSYQNWAEDFAEFATMHYFTQTLGLEYEISIYDKGMQVFSYEPFKNHRVNKRSRHLQVSD